MRIVWTHEALVQLTEIEDYISKDSPKRAAEFIDRLIEHTEEALSDEPQMGRTVPEIANPDMRELIFNHYRIVYRVGQDHVEILTVFEGHRLFRTSEIDP